MADNPEYRRIAVSDMDSVGTAIWRIETAPAEVFVCGDCGSLVFDQDQHDQFHRGIDGR